MDLRFDDLKKIIHVHEECTILELLDDLGIQEIRNCITINGKYFDFLSENHQLKKGDQVEISPELLGGGGRNGGVKLATTLIGIGAIIATGGIGAGGVLGTTQIAVARAGVLIGSQFLILGVQKIFGQNSRQDQNEPAQNLPNYGLNSGSNSMRALQPIPVVMGRILVNPDISSRPYNEPIKKTTKTIDKIPAWADNFEFEFDSSNMNFSGNVTVGGQDFYYEKYSVETVDNFLRMGSVTDYMPTLYDAKNNPTPEIDDRIVKTYVWITGAAGNDPTVRESFVLWDDLLINGMSAFFIPGLTYNSSMYKYVESFYMQHDISTGLKQIFNYGFGDLTITPNKIGNTPATDYVEFNQYDNTEQTNNYPLEQVEPLTLGATDFEPSNKVNGNVYTVDGGELVGGQWIKRESPDNIFSIQIDMRGQQFEANPKVEKGIGKIGRNYIFQYRKVGDTDWIDFPNSVTLDGTATPTIYLATMNKEYKNTWWVNDLEPAKYEVQIKKESPEERFENITCRMFIDQIRFYHTDINHNYPAQNRKGVTVEASSQLNGVLDTFSSEVRSKCWRYNGSDSYTWTFTENPSDWFLYFARGAFKNTSADGTLTYPFSPTVGWVNSADHPDNGEILFGCGYKENQIDFDSLKEWWNYCNDNNLTFNALMDSKKTQRNILQEIARAGRGSPNFTIGKLGVIYERPNQPAIAIFGQDDILKNSFKISYINQKTPDKIICEFSDRSKNYEQSQVEAVMPTVTNVLDVATVQLWGTVSESEAQRTANLLISRQLYNKRLITFKTDASGNMFSRGDVISISHDSTQWGYSCRIKNFEMYNNKVKSITFDTDVDELISEIFVRDPFNVIHNFSVIIHNNVAEILDNTPWLDTYAPYYYKHDGSINVNSQYSKSWLDDFVVLAGASSNGGKKCRIKELIPSGTNQVEIVAYDEEDAYYSREFLDTYIESHDYEMIKASVFNPCVEFNLDSQRIAWEKTGCNAVSIMIKVNGSSYAPLVADTGATIFSNFVDIYYLPGDDIGIIINPVVVGVPYLIDSAVLNFEVQL